MLKDKEIANTDKQLKNLLNEYQMVKRRIEKASDFNYTVDLKQKLAEAEAEIRKNNKTIRDMEREQKRRDIQMNRLLKEEKSEVMRKVDYNHQKLTYMQEKIHDVQAKLD